MKAKSPKSLFLLFLNITAVSVFATACGKVSQFLDKNKTVQDRQHHSVPFSKIKIEYKEHAPTLGENWSRDVGVYVDGKPAHSVIVEIKRYSDSHFRMLGVTNEQGELRDDNIREHTKYRIGTQIITEWSSARRDLIWTSASNVENIIKDFAPLDLAAEKTISLSNPEQNQITIDATRVHIEPGAAASWNRDIPLYIRASSINVDGSFSAFADNCISGQSAASLSIEAESLTGKGVISWSGCRGANGMAGESKKFCDDGKNGQAGANGGNGGSISIFAKVLDLRPNQLEVNGGSGGLGGLGGRGGKAIVMRGRYDMSFDSPCNGGKRGKDGKAGSSGRAGNVQVTLRTTTEDDH